MNDPGLVVVWICPAGALASIAGIMAQYAAKRLAPALRYPKSCNARGGGGEAACSSDCGGNIFYNRILVHTRPNNKKVEGTHPPSMAPCVNLSPTSHMYPRTTPFLEHLTRVLS